jgi:sugar phosphate isomerase/epimerase
MMKLTRRSFAASSLAAASLNIPLFARKLSSFGVQLYTVRSIIEKDPALVLKEIEGAGYKEIEASYETLDKIWPGLQQTKLKPIGVHLPTDLFLTQQDKLPAALEISKKHGFSYVICPWIDPKDRGGVDMIKKLADNLNKSGALANAAGLTLCYHNHAFEFGPAGNGTLLDVLLTNTDPKLVSWEMDIFWVTVGGGDPIALLKKYPHRAVLMHLKDLAPGVEHRFNENVPRTAFKELGAGTIDIKRIVHAAYDGGVKHFFVEQDSTPGDPIASLKISATYLKSLDF